MTVRAEVKPELLVWARQRSRLTAEDLKRRFPRLDEWERGDRAPTLRQLENFASATHTPVGFLFLSEPPDEEVPIPDYRTMEDAGIGPPSPDLLDTIFQCQQRQEWYRDYCRLNREEPVTFVGSLDLHTTVVQAAQTMRDILSFDLEARGSTWAEALRRLSEHAEDAGVLVMVNGVVGSNTHRRLDPHEFRGFALVDPLAPLVFINGADTKAAQMFTLAHELAHLWLGETALSDADVVRKPTTPIERWCNQVAAEFLVPIEVIRHDYEADQPITQELERLARRFKVSTLVVLRRLNDADRIGWDAYRKAYRVELRRILEILGERGSGGGGDFYNTQPVRVSKRFARAIVTSTLEGYHTKAAAELAAPLVGEKTVVATLQNGWGNGEVLATRFGQERTVVGVTYNSGTIRGIGEVAHTGSGPTFIGPYAGSSTEHAQPLGEALAGAGFEVTVTDDARTAVWKKLVLNCATLPTAALTRLTAGPLGDSSVLDLAHALAREATAVARILGYDVDPDERVETITGNLRNGGSGKASMLQDVEAGRRTEIGVISGAVVTAAAEHGVEVPLTRAMLSLVQGLEQGAGLR